ncbi:MAG: hypothetical protein ABIT76_13255 [Chthoniobacterales bacterium]
MNHKFFQRTSAFSLVEVAVAVGIAGFCLMAIFGLLPVALKSNQSAVEQTSANAIIATVVSDLRATPPTSPPGTAATSSLYSISIPASNSPATQTLYFDSDRKQVASANLGRYRTTLNFLAAPAGSGVRSATGINIKVSWPPAIDPSTGNPNGFVQAFAALDRN